ncbi:MAG: folate family ECF transporter S component [Clostridiales bacterium]|nr:folate family ECF transporter S component [Clostridiales bacterium]MCD8369763.1 folate family ECF transporter S component [Clostridiales bacterium]
MRKTIALFSDSCREFSNTRTITVCAMFAAISVVLGYFTIAVGDYIKIGFSMISNQFVYYLFGPAVGCIFGGALDILKYLIKPTGGYFPPLTLVPMVGGLIYGCFYYRRKLTIRRILMAELMVSVICNMLMTTFCLSILYGKGFMALLPMRVMKNLVMWPINSLLFYSIARALEAAGVFRLLREAVGMREASACRGRREG